MQLTGWVTTFLGGNYLSFDTSSSPLLNHFNSEEDRKIVIGEKSLAISDRVDFQRKVSQTITSSPSVKLEDGDYSLTAKVRNSAGFGKLEMFAFSNGQRFEYSIKEETTNWKTIKLESIKVKNGKVEIGFLAEGNAKAYCYVDDVELIRAK